MNIKITKTGVKIGSKGLVANTPDKIAPIFGSLSKGDARKLRKELSASGLTHLASVRRAA